MAVWERTTLFDGDATPEASSGDFSNTVHNLGFKQGSSGPRHDLTDGYQFFVLHIVDTHSSVSPTNPEKKLALNIVLPSVLITESSENSPAGISLGHYSTGGSTSNGSIAIVFARNTNTSFKIAEALGHTGLTSEQNVHLFKIEGLKLTYQPESI